MKQRSVVCAGLAVGMLTLAAVVHAATWTNVPGAARFARPGAARVLLQVRQQGGGACGGGGCTAGVEVRNVRGVLPSSSLAYYYSDRPGANPGCFGTNYSASFTSWTELEVAPIAGTEADRPSCGLGIMVRNTMQYWVILRVLTP